MTCHRSLNRGLGYQERSAWILSTATRAHTHVFPFLITLAEWKMHDHFIYKIQYDSFLFQISPCCKRSIVIRRLFWGNCNDNCLWLCFNYAMQCDTSLEDFVHFTTFKSCVSLTWSLTFNPCISRMLKSMGMYDNGDKQIAYTMMVSYNVGMIRILWLLETPSNKHALYIQELYV